MRNCVFVVILLVLGCCSTPKEKIPDSMPSATPSSSKLIIYQVMTRLFGNQNTTNKRYGTIEENGVGKFNDINDAALQGIKTLGVTHVWYTGVIEHALLTDYTSVGISPDDADVVKGRAGSPYAIKDYYDVNPDLAVNVPKRMEEFEQLVARTHNNDLKVIIDFVPNHVARSYRSDVKPEGKVDLGESDDKSVGYKRDNNFYYLLGHSFTPPAGYVPLGAANVHATKDFKFDETPAKVTGNDQLAARPGINDWFDAVKLNYGVNLFDNRAREFEPVPDTWNKMRDILLFWTSKGVDGFRCDMAAMVPVEFWSWVIPQVKSARQDIIFIAEIYEPHIYAEYMERGRFDFLYDKVQLYDTLRLLTAQKADASAVAGIQASLRAMNGSMLHFMENHDEQRIASRFFASDAWKAVPGMIVSATIDKGPVMIYFGQEVGEPAVGVAGFCSDDGRTTIYDYWGVAEHQKWVNNGKFDGGQLDESQKQLRQFYGDILSLAASNPAIAIGEYVDLTSDNVAAGNFPDRYVVFGRAFGEEKLIVIAGFNPVAARIKVRVSEAAAATMRLDRGISYIGRDLLRSGTDVGLNEDLQFEVDVPPYSGLIFKIK